MKIRLFLVLFLLATSYLSLTVIANADTVIWTSETYRAYAYASTTFSGEQQQEYFSPPLPLPLLASAYTETLEPCINPGCPQNPVIIYGSAYSDVSNSIFDISSGAYSFCCEMGYANSVASFTGTFTAYDPYFKFNYGLTTSVTRDPQSASTVDYTPIYDAWLSINSLTSGTTIFDAQLNEGFDTISVALPYGDSIEVSFGISAESAPPPWKVGGTRDAALTFSTTVVPEPISSTLFIVGGATLGFRRYLKKRRTV